MSAAELRRRAWNAAMTASPGALDVHVEASRVEGAVPRALRGGRMLSNGPGWTSVGGRLAHPFDGHGYLRSLALEEDGSVRLRARFVETEVYREERAAGRLTRRGLGTRVSERLRDNVGFGKARNVANTTVVPWAGRLLAGWEGGAPHAVDPDSLHTRGVETFGGALPTQAPTLAHARYDAERERLLLLTLGLGRRTRLTFREVDAGGAVVETREAEVPGGLFAHDFFFTPRWYVLAANPLKVRLGGLAKAALGASTLLRCLEVDRDAPGAVHLVPRGRPGPVRTVTLPGSAFVVHFANAFEEDGCVQLDACLFSHFEFGAEFGFVSATRELDPALPDARAPQRLRRITVKDGATRGDWRPLCDYGVDFPRIHPRHEGKPTARLVAATRADRRYSDPFDSVLSLDLTAPDRAPSVWTAPEHQFLGEPLYAPSLERDGAGHVLALSYDGLGARTTLLVFDAEALSAGPLAQVPLPLLPYGFHGHWLAPEA